MCHILMCSALLWLLARYILVMSLHLAFLLLTFVTMCDMDVVLVCYVGNVSRCLLAALRYIYRTIPRGFALLLFWFLTHVH